MPILNVFTPIITDKHQEILDFYKRLFQEEEKFDTSSDGLRFSLINKFLILSAVSKDDALELLQLPVQIRGIFTVTNLDDFLVQCKAENLEILAGPGEVFTGRNFYVRHPDGNVFEYLQLSARE